MPALSATQAFASQALFRSAKASRPATRRTVAVRAQEQEPMNGAVMKTVGAIAAAQILLSPLAGAASADGLPRGLVVGGIFDGLFQKGQEAAQKVEAAQQNAPGSEFVRGVKQPSESQEENAERTRREAENTTTTAGDARIPTSGESTTPSK